MFLSIYLSIHLSIHLSIYTYIHTYIHTYIYSKAYRCNQKQTLTRKPPNLLQPPNPGARAVSSRTYGVVDGDLVPDLGSVWALKLQYSIQGRLRSPPFPHHLAPAEDHLPDHSLQASSTTVYAKGHSPKLQDQNSPNTRSNEARISIQFSSICTHTQVLKGPPHQVALEETISRRP